MPDPYLVKPDTEFLQSVLDGGGGDLKKCFQCATCSVVCELSNGRSPFPRKEMIWAQWGLKDRMASDPDIWLCHQCNDCSTKCPRGARPAEVLAALRKQHVQHYAVPQFLGRAVNQVSFLPWMVVIPAVLLGLALLFKPLKGFELLAPVLGFMDHEGFYAELFPHWLLIGFFSFFIGLAVLGAAVGVVRFWRAMRAADEAAGTYTQKLGIVASIIRTLTSIFKHDKFGQCQSHASRRLAHLGAFYGFVALFLVSLWAVIALYMINPFIENDLHYPFGLLNPWKILANIGSVVLIGGCIVAIRDRAIRKDELGAGTFFDRVFLWVLLGVGVTGLLTEVFRLVIGEPANPLTFVEFTAYAVYIVHLILVFDLLVFFPYTKFAHVVFRTVALVYAEHTGRSDEGLEAEQVKT